MSKRITPEEFLGKNFGYLTTTKYISRANSKSKKKQAAWECLCKCGNTCTVIHTSLVSGNTKSCGCLRYDKYGKNLIGKKFGKLLVTSKENYKIKNSPAWKCLCDCGKTYIANTKSLTNYTKSCGCARNSKLENLIGQTFNYLCVIDFHERSQKSTCWLCQCICGKIKPIIAQNLKNGNQKSCGCKNKRRLKNLVGQTFDYLTVKEYAGLVQNGKTRRSAWRCQCKCGTELIVPNNALKSKQTTSCGCRHKEIVRQIKIDLTGQVFGMLKVIKFVESRPGGSYWLCRCECGVEKVIGAGALKKGQQSCGCRQGWWRAEKPGLWKDAAAYAKWLREDPVHKLHNGVSNSIRGMLLNQGKYKRKKSIQNFLPYTIKELKQHIENLWEPWMNWDNYGGKTNDTRQTWQIDHIKPHSSFRYTSMGDPLFAECWALSNLRPLEKKANMSKGNREIESED